ncbi:MAG: GTPase ObgE [Thermomicrobiales bacterium]|nr:GTPase ObgE [Thermomicrobiales bacterium]
MALVDTARIFVKSGKGGNGSTHFRREKYAPKGGPDGGDGGRGGDVIFRVKDNLNSLLPFQYVSRYIAKDGQGGMGNKKFGRSGADVVVNVPPGTVVFLDETDEQIIDLTEPGEEFIIAKGGKGGLGNVHFKSSTRQAPRIAELGEPGQEYWLRLELRLIADVGLVGLPNAGKSTLLASSTRAKPKIADYPFTTLQPNLGVVEVGGPGGDSFVLADIPGLIEGAAEGHGLGHEFLRHVRRTKLLLHVLDASGGVEGRDPLDDFRTINRELFDFDPDMQRKPMIVALNKIDLPEAQDNLPRLKQTLTDEGYEIYEISAATGEGVRELQNVVAERMRDIREHEAEEKKLEAEKPKRRVYTIGNVDERAWDIERVAPHHYVVSGVGLERFAAMTNFDQWESAERFQRVLDRTGVLDELEKMGIEEKDTVTIGTFEMTWGESYDEKPWAVEQDDRLDELLAEEEDGILVEDWSDDEPDDDEEEATAVHRTYTLDAFDDDDEE